MCFIKDFNPIVTESLRSKGMTITFPIILPYRGIIIRQRHHWEFVKVSGPVSQVKDSVLSFKNSFTFIRSLQPSGSFD